jgi:hypothetical protein
MMKPVFLVRQRHGHEDVRLVADDAGDMPFARKIPATAQISPQYRRSFKHAQHVFTESGAAKNLDSSGVKMMAEWTLTARSAACP